MEEIQQIVNPGINLHDVLFFLMATVIIVPLFRRLRLSSILGYLVAGAALGPYGFQIIDDVVGSNLIAEFGVVFLMFTIGLELSFNRLKTMRRNVFGLGSSQVVLTSTTIAAIAHYGFGQPAVSSLLIGGALALSSTAFVLQLLHERAELATVFGQAAFAILLFQDLAVVPMVALTSADVHVGVSLVEVLAITFLKAMVALGFILLLGHKFLRPVYHIVTKSRSPEVFTSLTLLSVLGIGYLTSSAGLSMELGAFLAGLLLSESEYRHQVEADIHPFRGLLLGLFFISVGMKINFGLLFESADLILFIVFGLLFLKALILFGLMKAFHFETFPSLRTALLLCQGGEFAFVLLNHAVPHGVVSTEVGQLLYVVVALSLALTPFLVTGGWYLTGRLNKSLNTRLDWLTEKTETLSNHVVIAGFGRVGRAVGQLLTAQSVPIVALEIDPSRVAQGRAKSMPVYYGDASVPEVLRAVGTKRARAVVITMGHAKSVARAVTTIRLVFPEVAVYVRARDGAHVRELQHIGATATVPETLEASLQLGAAVLSACGKGKDEVSAIITDFRREIIMDHFPEPSLEEDEVEGNEKLV